MDMRSDNTELSNSVYEELVFFSTWNYCITKSSDFDAPSIYFPLLGNGGSSLSREAPHLTTEHHSAQTGHLPAVPWVRCWKVPSLSRVFIDNFGNWVTPPPHLHQSTQYQKVWCRNLHILHINLQKFAYGFSQIINVKITHMVKARIHIEWCWKFHNNMTFYLPVTEFLN